MLRLTLDTTANLHHAAHGGNSIPVLTDEETGSEGKQLALS